jgi:hypothetical protein
MREKGKTLFSALHCERVDYELSVSFDKFNFKEFTATASLFSGMPLEKDSGGLRSVVTTRDQEHTDYHVHLSCRWRKQMFRASLGYVEGALKPDPSATEPFAEDVMAWLGRFFNNGQVSADVDAKFYYPRKNLRLLLPMPMRIPVISRHEVLPEVEVFGMAVNLPTKPEGAYEVYTTLLSDAILLSVTAERTVKFAEFDLRRDLTALSSVSKVFLEGTPL